MEFVRSILGGSMLGRLAVLLILLRMLLSRLEKPVLMPLSFGLQNEVSSSCIPTSVPAPLSKTLRLDELGLDMSSMVADGERLAPCKCVSVNVGKGRVVRQASLFLCLLFRKRVNLQQKI